MNPGLWGFEDNSLSTILYCLYPQIGQMLYLFFKMEKTKTKIKLNDLSKVLQLVIINGSGNGTQVHSFLLD